MANRPGRAVLPEDRRALLRALGAHRPDDFEALRTTALIRLAWDSGLRVSECLALDLPQVLDWTSKSFRVRSGAYLKVEQAKGSATWTSAGQFVITLPAGRALKAYALEARRRGWLRCEGAIFVALRRTASATSSHGRLTHAGARKSWYRLQRRAGLRRPWYRFHDLRHDAITRFSEECSGDAFKVARFGRLDVRTAQRYVHTSFDAVAEIARRASR